MLWRARALWRARVLWRAQAQAWPKPQHGAWRAHGLRVVCAWRARGVRVACVRRGVAVRRARGITDLSWTEYRHGWRAACAACGARRGMGARDREARQVRCWGREACDEGRAACVACVGRPIGVCGAGASPAHTNGKHTRAGLARAAHVGPARKRGITHAKGWAGRRESARPTGARAWRAAWVRDAAGDQSALGARLPARGGGARTRCARSGTARAERV